MTYVINRALFVSAVILPFVVASFPQTYASLISRCAKCLALNCNEQMLGSLKELLPDELYLLVQSEALKRKQTDRWLPTG